MSALQLPTPWQLVCQIIQNQMGLAPGQVYLWDQKIILPPDSALYVAVGIQSARCFSNSLDYENDPALGLLEKSTSSWWANLSIDLLSKGPDARDRKEECIMALVSTYSRQLQELNGFGIASLPTAFNNLSTLDGASIPYRFNASLAIQYKVSKSQAVPYYDTFLPTKLVTEP